MLEWVTLPQEWKFRSYVKEFPNSSTGDLNLRIIKSGILDTEDGFSRFLRFYAKRGLVVSYANLLGVGIDTFYSWRTGRRNPSRWVKMAVISMMARVSSYDLFIRSEEFEKK